MTTPEVDQAMPIAETGERGLLIASRDPGYLSRQRGQFSNKVNFAGGQSVRPYSYQVVQDPTGSAPTQLVERFELREGDCFSASDCSTDRERAEISIADAASYAEEAWYQMYLYVPEGFHVRNTYSHVGFNFHTNYRDGRWRDTALITPIMGGTESVARHYAMVYNGQRRERLFLKPYLAMVGRWTKIELHSKWHEDGFHRFFYNDELVYDYRGYTLGADAASPFRLQYGIYRGSIESMKQRWGYDVFPTQTELYSGVRKSSVKEGWV